MSFEDIQKIDSIIRNLLKQEGGFEKAKNILVNLQKSILCFSKEDEKDFDFKKAEEIASILLNNVLEELKSNEFRLSESIGCYAFTEKIDSYLNNIRDNFLSDDFVIHKLELDTSSSKVAAYFKNRADGETKAIRVSKEGILFLDDAIVGVIDGEFYQEVYDFLTQEDTIDNIEDNNN